jgi:hypothetical protein
MHTIIFFTLLFAASLMAQEAPDNIRNLCDTLRIGETTEERTMKISLDTIYDFRFENDNQINSHFYRSIEDLSLIRGGNSFSNLTIPVSIESQCLKSNNACSIAFYDANVKKWAAKDTSCVTQIYDIHESLFDVYDSANSYNWIQYRFEDWSANDPVNQTDILLSVTPEMRASSWMTIAYVEDTLDGGSFRYWLGMSRNVDSLLSVTGAIGALAETNNKVIYRQTLKFVLAEEKLIVDDPPIRIIESTPNQRPSFSMQRTHGGVLIRCPKGEVPSLRLLNGTSVSGNIPVSAGVYFISIEKDSWHRIFVQD